MALTLQKTNHVAAIQASFHRSIASAVSETVETIEQDARDRVAVESGELRDSIGSQSNGMQGEVIAASDHALWVEFGTEKQAAQPFLTPAALENADSFATKIVEGLK